MRITRLATAILVSVGTSVGFAADAAAIDPPATGFYKLIEDGVPHVAWKIWTICDQASGTREQSDYTDPTIQAEGCSLHVDSMTPEVIQHADKVRNYSAVGKLTDDQWTFLQNVPGGITCPDGSYAETSEKYSFNEDTLTGLHTTIHGAVCGGSPGMTKHPFSLQFLAPPNVPIERFPMYCNGNALCW